MTDVEPTIERAEIDTVEPARLAEVRRLVRATVPAVVETFDRRGFQLLHWPVVRTNPAGKPIELSLEHEARLRPSGAASILELQRHLDRRRERALFDGEGPGDRLIVRRVERPPGAQSVDRYWDVDGRLSGGFTKRAASFRQRTRTSKFMTWSNGGAETDFAPFNLELPLVALGGTGVVARLEFNWIDAVEAATTEFDAILAGDADPPGNPLALALRSLPAGLGGALRPALEHTTFREKFALLSPSAPDAPEYERFHLNIDHMVVQSLRTGHVAHHCDVDVAAGVPVDAGVLAELEAIAAGLRARFGFVSANAPKVWWGATVLGELD